MTDLAFVGEGVPERFAEGAATGTLQALRNSFATGSEGILTPTVPRPAVTSEGIASAFFIMTVMGPGMKASMSFWASGVISATISLSWLFY